MLFMPDISSLQYKTITDFTTAPHQGPEMSGNEKLLPDLQLQRFYSQTSPQAQILTSLISGINI